MTAELTSITTKMEINMESRNIQRMTAELTSKTTKMANKYLKRTKNEKYNNEYFYMGSYLGYDNSFYIKNKKNNITKLYKI